MFTEEYVNIHVKVKDEEKVNVKVKGTELEAPGVVKVNKSKEDLSLTVINEDCAQQIKLESHVEPTFWINVINGVLVSPLGGSISSSIDAASEKMWTYQESVEIICDPEERAKALEEKKQAKKEVNTGMEPQY